MTTVARTRAELSAIRSDWAALGESGNRFGCGAGLFEAVRDNSGDRIANVAHLALTQNRVTRFLHHFTMLVRHLPAAGQTANAFEIGACDGPLNTRLGFGRAGVDLVDFPMRHIGAQEIGHKPVRERLISSV